MALDMEFLPPNSQVWSSRLTPGSFYNPQWPPQMVRAQVINPHPDQPQPDIDSGQTPGQWSNKKSFKLVWSAVNDPLLNHYEVCRNKQNDGQGNKCDNVSGTSYIRTLDDGIYDFEVTAVASDSKRSSDAEIDDIQIDATPPTAHLSALPERVTARTHLLTWTNGDSGGSGLNRNKLEYQINGGSWVTLSAVNNPAITTHQFDFPGGQHGDHFNFRLRTRDEAKSWSNASQTTTIFAPEPELQVSPPQLSWLTLYTNTLPRQETITIENIGGETLTWNASTDLRIVNLDVTNGTAPTPLLVTLTHPVGITGTYTGSITISGAAGTHQSPQTIPVRIMVVDHLEAYRLPLIFKHK